MVSLVILTSQQLKAALNQLRVALKEVWRIFPSHLERQFKTLPRRHLTVSFKSFRTEHNVDGL